MAVESHRVIRFRCAETGRRFVVVFHRPSQLIRFQVVNVVDEGEFSEKKSPKKVNSPATTVEKPPASKAVKQIPTPGQTLQNLLPVVLASANKLLQKFIAAGEQTIERIASSQHGQGPSGGDSSEAFNPADFDFSGWYCPCCGYGKQKPASVRFVQCGKCGDYICGTRLRKLPNGQTHFTCHNRCGYSGVLGSGTISSYNGRGLDKQKPALLNDKASRQLKQGQHSLPPGKGRKG